MTSPGNGLLLVPDDTGLAKVAGLSLLHRALLAGCRAGVQEWRVLSWHHPEQVYASLASEARFRNISWQVVDVQKATPTAVGDALQAATVLVLSCTAVFDCRLLLHLPSEAQSLVCVTTSEVARHDPAAEGVELQQGRVTAASSECRTGLYATGILRAPGDLLARILHHRWRVMQSAPAPVSVLLHALIDATPVHAVDISPYAWVPLTAPVEVSAAEAETRLLRGLGREGDSVLVRGIDRRLSQALTRRLSHTWLTPNHITLLSALIGLSGAALLAQPLRLWQVLGSLLFLLSTITDGCDGELARLTFQESDFGARLDVIMDNVVHLFLFPCIALGLYRHAYQTQYLILGGLTLGGILLSIALYVPYLWSPPDTRGAAMRLHESLASRDFAYILPFLALFGKLNWFLWAAMLGTYAFAVALGGIYLFQWWQRYRRRSR